MPMSEHDAFLRAILAEPDEDGARLVFADWLDEHGDPDRADFIRVQCELARLPEPEPARDPLENRERALLARHEAAWLGEWPAGIVEWAFRRGFVEEVAGPSAVLRDHGAPLRARHPIREVRLVHDGTTDPAGLADALAGLRGLELVGGSAGPWRSVLALPGLAGLLSLSVQALAHPAGHPAETAALLHAAVRPALRRLDLPGLRLGADAVVAALWSPRAGLLEVLGLAGNGLGPSFAPAVSRAPALAAVRELGLAENGLGTAGVLPFLAAGLPLAALHLAENGLDRDVLPALAHSPACRGLSRLDLSDNRRLGGSLPVLAGTPLLAGLRQLGLAGCRLQPGDVLALSATDGGLDWLDLSRNGEGDLLTVALTGRAWAGGLAWLGLSESRLTDAAVSVLAEAHWPRLVTLHLARNRVTDRGVAELAASRRLPRLALLTLDECPVGDTGVRHLCETPHLPRLAGLGLSRTGLTAASADLLAGSPHLLGRLTWLDVGQNPALAGDALLPVAASAALSPQVEVSARGIDLAPRVRTLFRRRLGRRFAD
jgi:uncharacterized protein (TIGR02996 family)